MPRVLAILAQARGVWSESVASWSQVGFSNTFRRQSAHSADILRVTQFVPAALEGT